MSQNEATSQQDYVEKCKQAADKGNVIAQNTLGYLYLHGQGITQDYIAAVHWFRCAANAGYAASQYNLAIMYKLGQGIEQSHPNAIKWMQASANQGYAEAQSSLGNMYYQGLAVIQDYTLALMWWTLAERAGARDLEHNRHDISKKMTPSQLQQTQQLVQQWQIKH